MEPRHGTKRLAYFRCACRLLAVLRHSASEFRQLESMLVGSPLLFAAPEAREPSAKRSNASASFRFALLRTGSLMTCLLEPR